jgi:hypothetical protein
MHQTVPYGTALLRGRCPRHFVPGYDRTIPPGLAPKGLEDSAQGFNPGNRHPEQRALKGRQIERHSDAA